MWTIAETFMQALNFQVKCKFFHFRLRKTFVFKAKKKVNVLYPFNPCKDDSTPTSYTNNKNKVAIVLHLESIYKNLKTYLVLLVKANTSKRWATLKSHLDLDEKKGKSEHH